MDDVSKSVIMVVLVLTLGAMSFVVIKYILDKTFSLLVNMAVTTIVSIAVFSYCNSASHKCDVFSASATLANVVDNVHVYSKHMFLLLDAWWKIIAEKVK
jgi:hypothetical protein